MRIERVRGLSQQDFIDNYVVPNQPVIVVDAMAAWPARQLWTPDYLADTIGEIPVQIYDDLFGLQDVTPLADYIDNHFDAETARASTEYVRGYSRLKPVDFFWADAAFARLAPDWDTPYFLPQDGYLVPQGPARAESSLFPYRGLFISSKGCRTRLHRDPWTTSAVLCQFHGSKRVLVYPPDQARYLTDGVGFADLKRPDPARFPQAQLAVARYDDVLEPGEILFTPSGWLHDVTTLSDSISITWNFIHESGRERLCEFLEAYPADAEREVLAFFLGLAASTGSADIVQMLRRPR